MLTVDDLLRRLREQLSGLTAQQRRAAQYVLDHPHDVGVSSLRQLAEAADVTPNTLVRLGQAIGLDGFETLRAPFRESARHGPKSPLERKEWLEALAEDNSAGQLVRIAAGTALENLERLFADTDAEQLRGIARAILKARATYVLGVGTMSPVAKLFTSLARTALDTVHATPSDSSLPLDDLTWANPGDVLLAMTFHPYRREVVETVIEAKRRDMTVIALTDSWRSPIAAEAATAFIIPVASPHIFASVVAVAAFLELLFAFIVKEGKGPVAKRISTFHSRRFSLGVYRADD